MNENFDKAFDWVMKWEGLFSDDPNDPGNWTGGQPGKGILKGTKFGISAMSYPSIDIKSLTKETAKEIYYKDYWLYNLCQNKPYPIDIIHFNTCINPGKAIADRILKEVITDEMYLLKLILYYSDLVNKYPIKKRYFVGWMNRVIDLMRLINI